MPRMLTARARRSSRRCIVEEGVGIGVEQARARRLDGTGVSTARHGSCRTVILRDDVDEACEVHRFLSTSFMTSLHQRMVGDLDVAFDVLEAGGGLREDAGEQVFGAGALDLRRDALAFGEAQQLQSCGWRPSASGF